MSPETALVESLRLDWGIEAGVGPLRLEMVARQLGARDTEAIAALRAERDAVHAAAAAEIQ